MYKRQTFVSAAQDYIGEKYGKEYIGKVKVGKKKENVQDAHEGIRPTSALRTPESVKEYLKPEELKLYSLIYARAMASLMAPAKFDATSVSLMNNGYEFKTSGSVIKFDGYLRVYGDYEKQSKKNSDDFLLSHRSVFYIICTESLSAALGIYSLSLIHI